MMASTGKTLVVGGGGFIGSHIVDRLRANGDAVRVMGRGVISQVNTGVEWSAGDFRDPEDVSRALTDVSEVLHCASTIFPGASASSFSIDVVDNLLSTVRFMELAEKAGVQRFVYVSSGGTVYGPTDQLPIMEQAPRRPINSYGIVKTAVELYGELFDRRGQLSFAAVRPSNPYGPRQGHNGVQGAVTTFLRRIRSGQAIDVWGNGAVVRDYLYVTELAELAVQVLRSDATGPFNAGTGVGHSLIEVIEKIAQITGYTPNVRRFPGRDVDVPMNVLDCTAARKLFNWEARVSLDEGIARLWAWMKRNEGPDAP